MSNKTNPVKSALLDAKCAVEGICDEQMEHYAVQYDAFVEKLAGHQPHADGSWKNIECMPYEQFTRMQQNYLKYSTVDSLRTAMLEHIDSLIQNVEAGGTHPDEPPF